MCVCVCVHVHVCVHMSVYIYSYMSSSVLGYVKIYGSSDTFDKHIRKFVVIFDENLVWQINQRSPKILPQCPHEVLLAVW